MTRGEIALFAISIALVVLVFVAEALRARGTLSARLPAKMLIIRLSLGCVFAILGVVGSVLPIMQGWIFFLLSALVFFPQSRFAVKTLDKIEPRMPRVVAWLRRIGVGTHEARDTIRTR